MGLGGLALVEAAMAEFSACAVTLIVEGSMRGFLGGAGSMSVLLAMVRVKWD